MPDPTSPDAPDLSFLRELSAAAGAETLPRFRAAGAVHNKREGDFDPVTDADRASEEAITRLIRERYPDHAILGEEYGASGESRYRWVIDPIDGTRSFISGVPLWGTLVGLTMDGRATLGLMSQPFTGETFLADERGAVLERAGTVTPLETRRGVRLGEATLFTTDPTIYDAEGTRRFETLRSEARLTRYGADCYAFAMLALGQADLVVEAPVQPYDIVALIPIIERAGGVVTTWTGERAEGGGPILAAGSPELHAEALSILNGWSDIIR